jgi:hypothetical protein
VVVVELTTNQKGMIAETAIIHECAKLGVGVSRPLDDHRYDLILDVGGRLLRVQCKWAPMRGDVIVVRCYSNRRAPEGQRRRRYESDEIDAIAAYCAANARCYLLPRRLSCDVTQVHLRLGPTQNNQASGVNWATDVEFAATLSQLQGPIAQLGERCHGMAEVVGSSPTGSTLF